MDDNYTIIKVSNNEGLVSLVRGPACEKESTSLKVRLWDADGVWPDSRRNYKTCFNCRPEGRRGSSLPAVQSQHRELPAAQIQLRSWAPCQVPFSDCPLRFPTSSRGLWALHGWYTEWEFPALDGAQASAETRVGRCGFKATAQCWRLPGSNLGWAGPEPLGNPVLALFGLIQETPGIPVWP